MTLPSIDKNKSQTEQTRTLNDEEKTNKIDLEIQIK